MDGLRVCSVLTVLYSSICNLLQGTSLIGGVNRLVVFNLVFDENRKNISGRFTCLLCINCIEETQLLLVKRDKQIFSFNCIYACER